MPEEIKKVEEPPKVPAPVVDDPKKEEAKVGPTGLDGYTADQLKEFYKRSPQMFEEAGIVKKEEEKKVEPPPEKKVEPPPAVSAAPKFGDVEIKLPDDVPVNRELVEKYLVNAKENGLTAKQVQAQIDFQTEAAREAIKRQPTPKVPTPEEVDTANVATLKAKWGEKYEENMEAARRAAVKFAGSKMLSKLTTSDPDLVEHFLTLADKDAEDKTLRAPNRNGNEGQPDEDADPQSHLKSRYPHPTSQGMFKGEQR